jgi:hypothetical protein
MNWRTASFCASGECVEAGWRTPALSGGANCVEAGPCACGGDVLVRDTKDRDGGTLAFSREAWTAFIADIKAGEYLDTKINLK